jgi:competence protein ComGC
MNEDVQATPQGNRAGVIGLILSIIGVCLCGLWLLTIPGLIVSLVGLRKEPRTAAIAGTILGGIGVLQFLIFGPLMFGIMLPSLSTARENARESVTRSKIQEIHMGSTAYQADNGRHPNSFDELTNGEYISSDTTQDAWDNPMQFEGGGDSRPKVTSAGSDGVFDTEDDIHSQNN